jgi:hypothetical protein
MTLPGPVFVSCDGEELLLELGLGVPEALFVLWLEGVEAEDEADDDWLFWVVVGGLTAVDGALCDGALAGCLLFVVEVLWTS